MSAGFNQVLSKGGKACAALTLLLAVLSSGGPASAAQAAAGSVISNIASLTYQQDGLSYGTSSNTANLTVAEVVNFTVQPVANQTVTAGDQGQPVAYALQNLGNGPHGYVLSLDPAVGDSTFSPTDCQIRYVHADEASGGLAASTLYTAGTPLVLAQGETAIIWAVCNIPNGSAGHANVALIARPVTATGVANVAAWTAGRAQAISSYLIGEGLHVSLVKSQNLGTVTVPTRAFVGSVVTYQLTAQIDGAGTATGVVITDPIPAGTSYVPGTLTLEGQALSDAADADAGEAGDTGVTAHLGDIVAPATRTVTFQVRINP